MVTVMDPFWKFALELPLVPIEVWLRVCPANVRLEDSNRDPGECWIAVSVVDWIGV